jgi:hypothetical protein
MKLNVASVGKLSFQLIGTSWGGIRLLQQAITKSAKCAVGEQFGALLTGQLAPAAEEAAEPVERAKLRIDRFQRACWLEAGRNPGFLWGHATLTEQVASLLAPPVKGKQAAPGFDALDYFICRQLDVPIIVLLRDGRACIPAKIKNENMPARAAVDQWRFSVHAMKRFALFNERCAAVRVEDLIAQPKEMMTELCGLIGIKFEDVMIEPLVAAQAVDPCGNDPKALARITASESWNAEIQDDLRDCGYATA